MKTKNKKLSPRQIAVDYLKKNNFFAYQKYRNYQAKLDQLIKKALSEKNPFNLVLPLPSELPPLTDQSPFYCLELGGTFLQLYHSEIKNSQLNILRQAKIDFYQNKTYTPKTLLQDLQTALDKFIPAKERASIKQLCLFFAFPIKPSLTKNKQLEGSITYFGKTHKHKDIIGLKVAGSLEKSLRANDYKQIQVSVLNDSLGNLLAGLSEHPLPLINIIAGTGTNISLTYKRDGQFHFSNLEFGDFAVFPAATFDQKFQTTIPAPLRTRYLTEKLFAGSWQHQLLQIIAQDLLKSKAIKSLPDAKFSSMNSAQLQTFLTQPITQIPPAKQEAFLILQYIWQELRRRGGFICAFAVRRLSRLLRLKPHVLLSGAILNSPNLFLQTFRKSLPQTELIPFEQNAPRAAAMLNQLLS